MFEASLLTSAIIIHFFESLGFNENDLFKKYAPFSALMSFSSFTMPVLLKSLSCIDDNNFFESSRPRLHTTFDLRASLGSALSTKIALMAYIPIPASETSSDLL